MVASPVATEPTDSSLSIMFFDIQQNFR